MYGNFCMHIKSDVFSHKHKRQDIKKTIGFFCDLTQQNTLVTYEMHVIILLKSFNML